MKTPICDFVRSYMEGDPLRLHMPGHKGEPLLGFEQWDLTEIRGADSLYEAEGIIAQSEHNASCLFGCPTFYSTEGASQCIRAMVQLICQYAKQQGKKPLIAAARNVHKTFLSAVALLDVQVLWLYPETEMFYLACPLEPAQLERCFAEQAPVALYLTSPDYLGNTADIAAIAKVCRKYGVLLAVDNAHGAYLKFLPESRHPVDLGADICCSSAHKTLPVLTGGAYLHISDEAPAVMREQAKRALALFGSTSPSYLILQSLDAVNRYLDEGYTEQLTAFVPRVQQLKERLRQQGWQLYGDEPLKLTLAPKSYGYTGQALSEMLEAQGLVCEFADPDFLVLMLTPQIGEQGLARLENTLLSIVPQAPVTQAPPAFCRCEPVLSIRQAMLAHSEIIPIENSIGRVLADASVGCPPAVPVVVCGERIHAAAVACFAYYGIETCMVIHDL